MKLLPAGPAHEREGGRGREGMAAAGFLLAVALGLAAAPSPAGAGTVVVLRSRALGVYDSLAAGFRASYRGSVADLVLGEADDPALGSRIAALHPDVVVAVGLTHEGTLRGFLVLGPKADGLPYTADDLDLLAAFAPFTALALASAG